MTDREKQRVWLGADAGASGAIALVNHPDFAMVYPLRGVDDRVLFQLLRNLHSQFDIQFALIEKINPVPDHVLPAVAVHKLIQHYAILKNAIAEAGIRMMEPMVPRSWQAMLGFRNKGGDKSISYRMAQQEFPEVKVTYWNADALLLAYLCQRKSRYVGLLADNEKRSYADPNQRRRKTAVPRRVYRPARPVGGA